MKPQRQSRTNKPSSAQTIVEIAPALLEWFDVHGRHDLPWQHDRTLYRVWVSEIMLQQTQVSTVIAYFERFMARFPRLDVLAQASLDEVLSVWSGLGYYARARNLHAAAQFIAQHHGGTFPTNFDLVVALAGIGRSTAGAILAQALDERHPILDGNVKRVLARYRAIEGWPGEKRVETQLWEIAETLTPQHRIADYTQAIMDLGATVCTRRQPHCAQCPLSKNCMALQHQRVSDFPAPKPSKTLPTRLTSMLIARNESGELLLIKRPPIGIWGGLWSFPEWDETTSPLEQWCADHLALRVIRQRRDAVLRHTFSHFQLAITPINLEVEPFPAVMAGDDQRWYNVTAAKTLGLAAPVRLLLDQIS